MQLENINWATVKFNLLTESSRGKVKSLFKALFVPVTVDEDSISDWSTDSCGWSDDDYGVDFDVTTPPLSVDSGAVDTNDQEIVRCICEVEEENDFMIQVSWLFFVTTYTLSIFKAL